jgi:hypothetical protein
VSRQHLAACISMGDLVSEMQAGSTGGLQVSPALSRPATALARPATPTKVCRCHQPSSPTARRCADGPAGPP